MTTDPNERLVRAARELLRWDQTHLAELTGLHVITIRRFERGGEVESETVERIVAVLQKAGIAFVGPQGQIQEGVTLSKKARPLPPPEKRVYPPRPKRRATTAPSS